VKGAVKKDGNVRRLAFPTQMSKARFVANGATFAADQQLLVMAYALFGQNPALLQSPYALRSKVSTASFELFLPRLTAKQSPSQSRIARS
jgi:hypothetical protein